MAPRLSFTLEPSLFRCARALRGVYEAGCGSSGRHHSTQFENKDMSSQQLPSIRDLFPGACVRRGTVRDALILR